MPNRSHEQELINDFIRRICGVYQGVKFHNKKCRSRTFSDIEFTLSCGQRWAIEAKSNKSKDKNNTVHKFFGELLKETGRENRENCNIGILIPECGIDFYRTKFKEIKRCKFICFGLLIPVRHVFSYGESGVRHTSWNQFYDQESPEWSMDLPCMGEHCYCAR